MATRTPVKPKPLTGVRVLSLALNLPGPAALMRLRSLGATCLKLEPPGSGDPMRDYSAAAYGSMHTGIRCAVADLKSAAGQDRLHRELARADVLLTSFRASALRKLGLDWPSLHRRHPHLHMVAIVGAPGPRADEPGHDLTYLAEHDLVTGLDLPPTLYSDMGGSLLVTEAVLAALLQRQRRGTRGVASGSFQEVTLTAAAAYLALPRHWGLTLPDAAVGGGHAGYGVYACRDGRIALAALESHFAARLLMQMGRKVPDSAAAIMACMHQASTQRAVARWLRGLTRAKLEQLAQEHDIPLLALAPAPR